MCQTTNHRPILVVTYGYPPQLAKKLTRKKRGNSRPDSHARAGVYLQCTVHEQLTVAIV